MVRAVLGLIAVIQCASALYNVAAQRLDPSFPFISSLSPPNNSAFVFNYNAAAQDTNDGVSLIVRVQNIGTGPYSPTPSKLVLISRNESIATSSVVFSSK
jgi:hypothetical protein